MDLVYFELSDRNFGDDLNGWVWDDLVPGWRDWRPGAHLMGVGTILNTGMAPPEGLKLVLGSGAGYGPLPDVTGPDWDIRAVRGPLTARAVGADDTVAQGDPAILLPRLARFADVAKTDETLFVPHYASDVTCDWAAVCARAGVAYQTPSDDAETVIRRIAGARRVIAESMHAAIVADAFGVPWSGVSLSADFNAGKWRDWSASLGMDDPGIVPFYRGLRALQRVKRRLLGSRRPRGSAARRAEGAAGFRMARRRKGYLEPFALRDLRRAARGRFRLTERTALAAAQDGLATCFARVAADYGGT